MSGQAGGARPLTVMLVVGEPSGDQIGAQLITALRKIRPQGFSIVGVGGQAMSALGLRSLFPLDDTAVMGLREVVPRIPNIMRRVREATQFALRTRPDLVILIDSPDFTHRIARAIKKRDATIRTVNYVAPQVWASRSYRARAMARYFDAVLTLFPFETTFFEQHGLRAIFVGYPVVERRARITGGAAFRNARGIAPAAPLLAVLPGSRRNEIRLILPEFREAVRLLAREVPGLVSVIATVPNVREKVREATADWPTRVHVTETDDDKFAAFDAADAALAASGTVTTELALARTPMVVAYKTGWLTYLLMHPLVRARYATLANIVLNREAVPEFIQGRCKPDLLAHAVRRLLLEPQVRSEQLDVLEKAIKALGMNGEMPSLRAARALLELAENR
ncbi:MAG: lipid-A-disaccharide synthase [Alphaproteobacteria bacterium]